MQQRQRGGGEERSFYCEMDASFNGLESEADREGGNAKADAKKGGGSTNGIQNHPIIFKSKSFQ